jgi:stage V sporulation protein S
MEKIRVSHSSDVNGLAGSITIALNKYSTVSVQAIGANALNQAIKAIATSRGFLAPKGIDLVCVPSYIELNLEDGIKTGLNLEVSLVHKGNTL